MEWEKVRKRKGETERQNENEVREDGETRQSEGQREQKRREKGILLIDYTFSLSCKTKKKKKRCTHPPPCQPFHHHDQKLLENKHFKTSSQPIPTTKHRCISPIALLSFHFNTLDSIRAHSLSSNRSPSVFLLQAYRYASERQQAAWKWVRSIRDIIVLVIR